MCVGFMVIPPYMLTLPPQMQCLGIFVYFYSLHKVRGGVLLLLLFETEAQIVASADIEFSIFPPQPPEYPDYKCA